MKRRDFLATGTMLGIGAIVPEFANRGGNCPTTPPQTEGPFYPLEFPIDRDTDLTLVAGRESLALGEKIRVLGRILTPDCQLISGARVEIWQACASGKYRHDHDDNPAPIDENFQYWGVATSDRAGNYSFTTVKPGSYPVTRDWRRPPHIHFKITVPNFPKLITQMYFREEKELNERDLILQRVSSDRRSLVITDLVQNTPGIRSGRFDIVLAGNRAEGTPEIV
jgi:protocatechuate 3,4-dioxygenase beta subunit